jgi:hypothetical protein
VRASSASTAGQIAIALAVIVIVGLVSISLYYALLQRGDNPFGTLNQLCVALGGILSGGLAWKLYPTHHSHAPRESRITLGLALLGSCLVPIGSVLVLFNVTGWLLAALVTTFGYALIGLWLVELSNSALHWLAFPKQLAGYGIITGWVMAFGLLAAPGILARIDTMQIAPWYVLIALFVGGLGWNIVYTIWCIGLGSLLLLDQ